MNKLLGFSSLFGAGFLFGIYGFFIRQLASYMSPTQQVYYRYFIASVLIFVFLLVKNRGFHIKKFLSFRVLSFGIVISLALIFFVFALLHTRLAAGTSSFYVGLLLVSILVDRFVSCVPITNYGRLSFVIATLGFIFLAGGLSFNLLGVGLIYGLLSGGFYSIGSYFKQTLLGLERLEILLVLSFFSALFMFMFSGYLGEHSAAVSPYAAVILLSFMFITLLAEYLTVVGFRNFNLYLGSIVLSLEIPIAGILGYYVYNEKISNYEIIGGLLIILAVIISNSKELVPYFRKKLL